MRKLILSILSICAMSGAFAQGVGVNTTGTAADTSAMLDVSSTTKGLLPPRMTTAQKNAIAQPAAGLVVYQTDSTTGLYCNNGTPGVANWQLLGATPALAYGYFVQSIPLQFPVSISSWELVDFNTTREASGMTRNGKLVTIGASGLYHVSFSGVSYALPASTVTVSEIATSIFVNFARIQPYCDVIMSGNSFQTNSTRDAILSLNAGDQVAVGFLNLSGLNCAAFNFTLTVIQIK